MTNHPDTPKRPRQVLPVLWLTGGALTIGLGDVAQAIGLTGGRMFPDGGQYAHVVGTVLLLVGAGLLLRQLLARPSGPRE